jgi:hypothetical protein
MPLNPIEYPTQACALAGIRHLHKGYVPKLVHAERIVPLAVLAFRTMTNAIGKCRL